MIGRNINSKKGTCDKNSRSFETIRSSQNLSVRAVGRDKTDGQRSEVRLTLWQKIENFFFAYNHLYSSPTRENVFFGVRFSLTRFLGRFAPQKIKRNMLRDQHRIFQF